MMEYVYRVICDISLVNNGKEYLRGIEDQIFCEKEDALAFIKSRFSSLGSKDYDFTFSLANGEPCSPIHPRINSIRCEMVEDIQYLHDRDGAIGDEDYGILVQWSNEHEDIRPVTEMVQNKPF